MADLVTAIATMSGMTANMEPKPASILTDVADVEESIELSIVMVVDNRRWRGLIEGGTFYCFAIAVFIVLRRSA